jgi:Ca2+-binding RTX toxin-like protein
MTPHRLALALLAPLALLLPPAPASAAVVDADLEVEQGTEFGPVTFTAARGERNRLTVSPGGRGTVFRDAGARVRARGDCRQVDRHTATCPTSEDGIAVRLGDRGDRVRVRTDLVRVRGGAGDDVLAGGRGLDTLRGDAGADRLTGGRGQDELTGGPGRDRVSGGSGDDTLVDGETDARSAPDVFVGGSNRATSGPDRGDAVSYASRRRRVEVTIGGSTTTGDRLVGVESAIGGRGDDRLSGDGRDNLLEGGPGDDLLRGRGTSDVVRGGSGDDRVQGDDGDDVVWGDEGADRLLGGEDDDLVIGREERGGQTADELECGAGSDVARSDGDDRLLGGCEELTAFSNGLRVRVLPAIEADRAVFTVTCGGGGDPAGCQGTLTLSGPDGEALGGARLDAARDATAPVAVPLSAAAVATVRSGALLRVAVVSDRTPDLEEPGGYRARLDGR